MVMRILTLLAMVLGTGCFSPTERDGVVACGAGNSCPPGMGCWDGLCYRSDPTSGAADARVDEAPDAEAGVPDAEAGVPDARPGPECDNGVDDDCDGVADWQDPGCRDEDDTDERGDRKCDNGADDDDDGFTDYVAAECGGGGDPECWGPSDDKEDE
jgi:hypothetical protein